MSLLMVGVFIKKSFKLVSLLANITLVFAIALVLNQPNEIIKIFNEKGFFTYDGGYQAAEKILKNKNVSAIFCADDTMAFGCLDYIKKNTTLKIPKNLEIIPSGQR